MLPRTGGGGGLADQLRTVGRDFASTSEHKSQGMSREEVTSKSEHGLVEGEEVQVWR